MKFFWVKARQTADTLGTLVVLVVGLLVLARLLGWNPRAETGPPPAGGGLSVPSEPLSLTGLNVQGEASADWVLIEFVDFECPACAQFQREVLPIIESKYVKQGKIRFAIWPRPLPIHPQATAAAEAAECAAVDGKFWGYHNLLFANYQKLDNATIRHLGQQAGVGPGFAACLEGTMSAKVEASRVAAVKMQVMVTPSFFLGRTRPNGKLQVERRWVGVRSAEKFGETFAEAQSQLTGDRR